jgi:LmbE family N-acetylglucosaminyl deacetylase
MPINGKMNILCVIAHPDDIELMAGGSISKWVTEGHSVHVLTFSDGVWTSPNGVVMREQEGALTEEKKAAGILGYKVENLQYPAMTMSFHDKHVCEVLERVERLQIDTIICPFEKDISHDHEIVSRIAVSATRRVKRVLMGQINYYLRNIFTPNYFVDISDTWADKIKALECFETQWERAGSDWLEYLDQATRYYGKMCGVERAEGFMTNKFLY